MKLLSAENRRRLPSLYTQENEPDPTVPVKFFTPDAGWTWYAIEFDGADTFFGYVIGLEAELGYFSLRELQTARGPLGLPIERDLHWDPVRDCPRSRQTANSLFSTAGVEPVHIRMSCAGVPPTHTRPKTKKGDAHVTRAPPVSHSNP